MDQLFQAEDKRHRCWWCAKDDLYKNYHDTEWGFPVADDRTLFEKVCLEGFQSGLSWYTILVKRENFRAAFDNFEFEKVAAYTDQDLQRLLQDAGIVRHKGKIEATINNARCALETVKQYGSLAAFFWQFEPKPTPASGIEIVSVSEESKAMAKALKKQGWKFVGPTTAYSFMQAMGLVNDHILGCHTREQVAAARLAFDKPS